jgi:hypothetical protein
MPLPDAPPGPPAQPPTSALVADIRHADATTVSALKAAPGVQWWLELGDQLLLVGEQGELRAAVPEERILGSASGIDRDRLHLHGRGCEHGETDPGRVLAQGGRWELRLLDADEHPPGIAGHEGVWQEVVPNTVLASRYHPDTLLGAPDPLILPLVNSVNATRWFADVEALASFDRSSYGTELVLSRLWIEERFEGLDLDVSAPAFTMPGPGSGQITVNNVLGMWEGTSLPDEWIIVGGHYDSRNSNINSTVSTPGAEDNASGCAGVIEAARVLTAFKPRRSILFMCYAGEEQNLYGSKAHVQALQASGDLAKVQAVVIMDMIGYSASSQLDVLLESNASWIAYLNRFAEAASIYVPGMGVTTSTSPCCSDHAPYLNAGRQSLLVIEKDWNIYPHYHQSTDIPVNLGVNALAMGGAIIRTNVAVLADMSGASDRIFADSYDP